MRSRAARLAITTGLDPMQWQHEWIVSLTWIVRVYLLTSVGALLAIAAVARFTRWGRQFWRLAGPFLTPRRSWRPMGMAALILLLAITAVRLNVLLSYWNNGFYDSIQALNATSFWFFMRLFGLLATLNVVRVLASYLISQAFDIRWRTWLNERLTDDWLADGAYYRTQFLETPSDNPDQRIQVDIGSFVTSSRTLAIGAVDAVVSLVEFSAILWGLSAPLPMAGVEVPRAMVFLVYLYVIIASVMAFRLGRPLIKLSFTNEKLAADFRYALIRLREYAENIAFYGGEFIEKRALTQRFALFIRNLWAIIFRSLKFDGFNLAVSQGAVVFPFLLQAHRFFSGAIKLGDVMQTAQAFGQVQDALSFFRLSYDSFAQYRAVLDRLTGFVAANEQSRALPRIAIEDRSDTLEMAGLSVRRPDDRPLVRNLNLHLRPGDALLVQGASGVGKTTLLRTLAGLWPYAQGVVRRPIGIRALFLPQRPYLPLGTLSAALTYPSGVGDNTELRAALLRVQLGHLQDRLDDPADWSHILSLGEQQRLAFARVLLNRPRIVFLDEATAAMDEGLEHAMYQLLRAELPASIIVSVGHRSTLNRHHTHRLVMQSDAHWHVAELPDGPG
jgi:putative ATP-binding cassette transporter